jgi:ubiquinol-cytochrome c reductase cytochrome c subunit
MLFVFLPIGAPQFAFSQQGGGSPALNSQAIFLNRCAKCHGAQGEGRSALFTILGPSLQAEHDPGKVLTAIETGPSHMPSFAWTLSVPEMRSVANYVTQHAAVIPLTGGNLSEGGILFREHCGACHRSAVRGGALAFTGVNAPELVGKSPALVAGAIRWGPGPMPPFPRSILSDQQIASIVDYVKLAQHPPDPGGSPLGYSGPVAEGFAAFIAIFILIGISMWIERGSRG